MIGLLEKAAARRTGFDLAGTDAFRLVDGEGDDLPGLQIDQFAQRLLVSTRGAGVPSEVSEWAGRLALPTYWKRLDRHERDAPVHHAGPHQDEPFVILENGLRYRVSFQAGYSQGIFLDQRENRRRVRECVHPGDTVLNTFAYTGAFSVCAAHAGAVTTTLDLSQPYLDWARDNQRLNEIDPERQHFCKGDTFHWLRRFAKQGRRFSGIILDPPTFSRDQKGKVFRAETDYGDLVALAVACLAPDGWLLCTTNCRRLSQVQFARMVGDALPRGGKLRAYPMPPDFTGEDYLKTLWVRF